MDQEQKAHALNFIVSVSHLFNTTYGTTHHAVEGVNVLDYRESSYPTDDFAIEYTIIDSPLATLQQVVNDQGENVDHILNVFHDIGNVDAMRTVYEGAGYTYRYTAPLQAIELPAPFKTTITVEEAFDEDDIDWANETLKNGERPMPSGGTGDPMIRRFYAIVDDEAIGWAQLVNAVVPGTAYIGDMYTLPEYRNQGVASALLNRMHEEAFATDCNRTLLVPSLEAQDFYVQFGYHTVAEFSVFKK